MKPLRFTSVEQEEVKDYEPIGSSIKFDTRDDELERIINQRASAVKSDIEAVRAKNKQMAQAREAAANESEETAQDASNDETFVARIPSVKFDDEDLPKIKLVDDDDLAQTNNEPSQGDTEPNDYENNDFSGLYEPLELKRDVNKNLQEISEALHEIDKMDASDNLKTVRVCPLRMRLNLTTKNTLLSNVILK